MAKRPAVVVGLLGGIGSGKTMVAGMFRSCGAHVLDADRMAHAVLKRPDIKRRLVRLWGRPVLSRRGTLDREKIAGIVFKNPRALARLESVVHPMITRMMRKKTQRLGGLVIWDAALLCEKGFDRYCDVLVYVDVPRSQRRRRVESTRRWTAGEFLRRERAQMSLNKKKRLADYIIKNSHSRAATLTQVKRITNEILTSVVK